MERLWKHLLIVFGTVFVLRTVFGFLNFILKLLTQYEQAVFVIQWAKYRSGGGDDDSNDEELPPFQGPPLEKEEINQFLHNLGLQ